MILKIFKKKSSFIVIVLVKMHFFKSKYHFVI